MDLSAYPPKTKALLEEHADILFMHRNGDLTFAPIAHRRTGEVAGLRERWRETFIRELMEVEGIGKVKAEALVTGGQGGRIFPAWIKSYESILHNPQVLLARRAPANDQRAFHASLIHAISLVTSRKRPGAVVEENAPVVPEVKLFSKADIRNLRLFIASW